jgi:hypothetical protein
LTERLIISLKSACSSWGAVFPWNPQHVLAIQIQSADKAESYDFWIDDLYFID